MVVSVVLCIMQPYAFVCTKRNKDVFLRVRRAAPLLPQLLRSLFDDGTQSKQSLCFVYDAWRLNQQHTVDEFELEDGDIFIIDAFNFEQNSSSLSIIEPSLNLKVVSESGDGPVQFTLKRSCRLEYLMKKYCQIESLEIDGAIFVHGRRNLMGSMTVAEDKLEDGDEITV
ncbi:Small ubiquitin-related modifier 1, partial [Bienertia sinuspersici]